VLARAADGDVCDAHVSCMAVFGQVSRIRHLEGIEIQACGRGDSWSGNLMMGKMYPKVQ
jgi:hypothetical protein